MQLEGFSIGMQLKEMRDFAERQGWRIEREYVDEGFSASSSNRPQFQMLVRDSRLQMFDVLLVHKLDRLYRNQMEQIQFLQSLRAHAVKLVSVTEPVDFDSIAGETMLLMLGALNEGYLRNSSEETRKGKHGRVLSGQWNGIFPFGYCRGLCSRCDDPNGKDYCSYHGKPDKGDGTQLIIHPKDSAGAQKAFVLCRTGKHSTYSISEKLNELGYRTRNRRPFTADAVCDLLRNPFYVGWVGYKGELHRANHAALVDQQTFDECQVIISAHARAKRNATTGQRFFLLTGLVRCSGCGHSMARQTNRSTFAHGGLRETRLYRERERCSARRGSTSTVKADELEALVEEQIRQLSLPKPWRERIAVLAQADSVTSEVDLTRRELRSQLSRLQVLFVDGKMTTEEYERREHAIQRRLAEIAEPIGEMEANIAQQLIDFGKIYDSMSGDERKQIIRKIVRAVSVKDGTLDRIEFRSRFKALQSA